MASYHDVAARQRYERSLRNAQIVDLLGLITGRNTDLVRFDEVAGRLKARQEVARRIEQVPLKQIVGSVGRYHDFTREFLPRNNVNPTRWAKLDAALNSLESVPPVELYKIGDVYFVRDGNHRVSVARANGLDSIEAYVTELESDVPLTLDDFERDRWIIKSEYADFLRQTRLKELRPDADLTLTAPGRYQIIKRHIDVHGYLRNQELERQGREERLGPDEIVTSWYDNVYLPVVEAIRRHGLLEHFPNRTEADLYLWIAQHREDLAARYGLAPLSPDAAVATFAQTHSDRPVDRTLKSLKLGLHRTLGDDMPLGISEEEFAEARARHQAGERTLLEAEQLEAEQLAPEGSPEERSQDPEGLKQKDRTTDSHGDTD